MIGRNRKMGLCFSKNLTRVLVEESPPLDVKRAFSEYVGGSGTHMTAEQLLRFAVEAQGEESAAEEDAEAIINEVVAARHQLTKFMRHGLNLDDFFHFLFSPDLNPPIIHKVHQDMDAPLSHYFIYTSHNSYLTGNQISSECSDVPLIKALQRGVRALELDLWPNSTKDDILVLHGWAWTPPVELIKCLRSIKEHAFSASPYPVILTLEDHLTPDLQVKAAQMINETFGEMVFIADSGCLKEFPSPEKLKHRVVISTKPPKECPDTTDPTSLSKEQNVSCEDESGKLPSDNSLDQQDLDKVESDTAEQNRASRLLAYKLLIAIPSGNAKNGLKESLVVSPDKVRRLSLREQKFEKATELYGTEVVRFTQKNLLRIFPKATRVNSSNYKPSTGWMYGAQMVAFNMQGYGRSLWLMHGMFRANGGCGYVKKPDFLMNIGPDYNVFDPTTELPVKKILKVKVYMGDGWDLDFSRTCFNTCSPPDLYTKVGIAGVPADKASNRTKRKDNSWKPVWDEEFMFRLTVPELALLRVEVHHYNMPEKDDFAGQTCLPVWELKPGLRAVPLFDRKGERLGSVRLLMRFQFF